MLVPFSGDVVTPGQGYLGAIVFINPMRSMAIERLGQFTPH